MEDAIMTPHSSPRLERTTLLAALLGAACATAPPHYDPVLSHVEVPVAPGGARVEIYASLRPIPADRELKLPAAMEAHIRLDNETDHPARIDPHAIELIARDLTRFPPAIVAPDETVEVAPGQSAVVSARFPYPAGERVQDGAGLHSVELRWTFASGDRPFTNSLTFDRAETPTVLSDPWFWEPAPRMVVNSEYRHR
jgi:hypothetical protein